jgi:hypothetical protein
MYPPKHCIDFSAYLDECNGLHLEESDLSIGGGLVQRTSSVGPGAVQQYEIKAPYLSILSYLAVSHLQLSENLKLHV